ncbi:MAG: hypothetical protein JWO08_3089 [Verrucomicrobiaceae bacterium]|nr:hypothetical protein [Verrucomicrobiaceae bacterium]
MNLPPIETDQKAEVVQLGVKYKKPVPEDRFLVVEHAGCCHFNGPYLIDAKNADVTCGQCKAKLNPMFVLEQLAHQETRWHEHFKRYQEEMSRLKERSRTKCQHCGEMTRISRS